MACISFPNGQSQRRVHKADLEKFLPNPRTKTAVSPIVNAVILDFAVIVKMLPPKTAHLQRQVLQCYTFAHYVKKQLESLSRLHLVRALA